MNKYILHLSLTTFLLMAAHSLSVAQTNITTQPAWGPANYNRADYYYLPDVESYYSILTHQFIYLSNGRWIYAANLPSQYKNYDLYSGYKVVVNKPRPYLNFSEDRVQYTKFKNWKGKQKNIRDAKYKSVDKKHGHNDKQPNGNGRDYGPM